MAPLTRSQAFEASDDVGRSPAESPTIGDVIAARYHRRDLLKGALGVTTGLPPRPSRALPTARERASFSLKSAPASTSATMFPKATTRTC